MDVLAARQELRDSIADAGLEDHDFPMGFGSVRVKRTNLQQQHHRRERETKPKKFSKKKRRDDERAAALIEAPDGALLTGELCECFYEGDSLWYLALVEACAEGEGKVAVSLVGYGDSRHLVPQNWLQRTERSRAAQTAALVATQADDPRTDTVGTNDASADGLTHLGDDDDGTNVPRAANPEDRTDEFADVDSSAANTDSSRREAKARRWAKCVAEDAPNPHAGVVDDKYWIQRYHYFSAFDDGVLLDAEGWYSVTPERVAQHIARRIALCNGVSSRPLVVDAFVGCGGNAIQLALEGCLVIAIDIDATRLAYARHNAALYDVAHRIDFVHGDSLKILPALQADVVFLSPPWGGPAYADSDAPYDVQGQISLGGLDGHDLVRLARQAAPNVVYFLPRTTDRAAAAVVGALLGEPNVELELNLLNGKPKAKTLYAGPRFRADTATDDEQACSSEETTKRRRQR